jgi:hypothetical protein
MNLINEDLFRKTAEPIIIFVCNNPLDYINVFDGPNGKKASVREEFQHQFTLANHPIGMALIPTAMALPKHTETWGVNNVNGEFGRKGKPFPDLAEGFYLCYVTQEMQVDHELLQKEVIALWNANELKKRAEAANQ